MRFTDKTAIVTGAGRNVGATIARRLADEGARVPVVDLDPGRGEATAADINAAHPGAHALRQVRRVLG